MRRRRRRNYRPLVLMVCLVLFLIFLGYRRNLSHQDKKTVARKDVARDLDDLNLGDIDFMNYERVRNYDIENAIRQYMSKEEVGRLEYFYSHIDLNGDGSDEKIVYIKGEYVSGQSGSPTLILDEDYNLIYSMGSTKTPIIVEDSKTEGWNDLIIMVGGMDHHLVSLKYNGVTYEGTRYEQVKNTRIRGLEILSGDIDNSKGINIY